MMYWQRHLTLLALGLTSACVDVNRGAIVQMDFQTLDSNVPGEHYELFATVNGGAVSVGRFKVLDNLDQVLNPRPDGRPRQHCGGDPLTDRNVQLVQLYEDDFDAEQQCASGVRIGTVDKFVEGVTLYLAGGIRLDTDVDLSEADGLFLSLETDGETDPQPAQVVARAAVARGEDPLTCAHPETPPKRRGVLLGSFVPVTDTRECPFPTGRVAIVPAEDETIL